MTILYRDVISDDLLASDELAMKEVDDFTYEIDCSMITIDPSADEQAEKLDDTTQTVNNVIYAFRLQQTSFDKKSYMTYLKGYSRKLKDVLQIEDMRAFETAAAAHFRKILEQFEDWKFYTGESKNPEGMVALLNYREDGITPYLVLIKPGLKEERL